MALPATKRLIFLLGSLWACAPAIAFGDPDTKVVDCSAGDSIQRAVESKNPLRPITVVIRGACTEQVTVRQDDVSLEGEGGTITGSVTIDGGRRVVVAGLTISNPDGDGVTVANGGSATLRNNHIDDSSGYGLFLRNAAFAIVNNNTMLRNGIINPTNVDASGIGVALGSMVRASGNEIRENANTGIEVFDNSTYRSEGDTIAMRASAPGRSAVDTFRAGHVDLRGVTVSGHVFVNQQSHLQVRNLTSAPSTLSSGNIAVSGLSFLRLRAGVARSESTLSCAASLTICTCDSVPAAPCAVSVP